VNKSTELYLHICTKDKFTVVQRWKHVFKFYRLFGNCNRLLFRGRLHFKSEIEKRKWWITF